MKTDEIRAAFLSFFESQGHKIIPSSSLIPYGDPTLLLTSAGMVQFKPYFLGEAVPPSPRLASCQKCFRTTDIESVGDPTHLTFFEMLGNFSIGDYFKKEAISWAWEFVTRRLSLPPERLWITIFLDDEDAFHYWRQIGVPEERILRLGEATNFWGPAGDSGPCGPCSEIHYDFGAEVSCQRPTCAPGCDCGRFSEIWNLVFTQYNQDKAGRRTPLPRPNIDTGMGLERVAAITQGKTSVYQTDLFLPLIQGIAKLAGRRYGANQAQDNALRIIAEHSRGIAFLIADGVMPDNEGRGYVLRRLLRRAVLFGRRLGLDEPFLVAMALTTIKQMGHIYPELREGTHIKRVIQAEEARFGETLNTGLELLDEIMGKAAKRSKKIISGEEAFKLHDTYGFLVELTKEIAAGRGFSVDLAGFEKEMTKQRERAKASHKFELGEKEGAGLDNLDLKATIFIGYTNLKQKATILSLLLNNDSVGIVKEGQEASLILDTTPFYGEMGGQSGDAGEIRSATGHCTVSNTIRLPPDITVHQGRVIEGSLSVGDNVEAEVDKERRLDIARNHTATHLLQAALRQVLGEHIQQKGSLVAPERLRFDFSHLVALTKEEISQVQQMVNDRVRQNLPVYDEQLPYKKAVAEGAIALFDEKYGDVVRVMKIGRPPISTELCGGTHLSATGEIGFFYIVSESSIGAGLRRIEAVTGRGAERYLTQLLAELEEEVASTASALEVERRRRLAIEIKGAKQRAESLISHAEVIKGVKVIAERVVVDSAPTETLRAMADILRDSLDSGIIVLGTVYEDKPAFVAMVTPDLVAKGYDAGKLVREVAKVAGGGGGGKATLAQAGGKDKTKLDEALRRVKSYLTSL